MLPPFSFIKPSTAAFNPLSVSGAKVWYDLGHSTNLGGVVTVLPDQSGNGNNATIVSGHEPTWTATNAGFNNLPTMTFPDGATKYVQTPDLGLTTGPATVVIVCSSLPSVSGYIVSASNACVEMYGDGVHVNGSNNDGATNLVGASAASASVLVFVANGGSSKLYVSAKTPVTGAAGAQDLTGQTIRFGHYGAALSGAGFWAQAGDTAHCMVFDGAMANTDVAYLLTGFGALAGVTIGA